MGVEPLIIPCSFTVFPKTAVTLSTLFEKVGGSTETHYKLKMDRIKSDSATAVMGLSLLTFKFSHSLSGDFSHII